jgi:hypothetical protein
MLAWMILVVLKMAQDPATTPGLFEQVGAITDLVRADVARRLAGILPRVLLVDADGDRLRALSPELARAGLVTVVFHPGQVPTDEDRLVAHTLERRGRDLAVQAYENGPWEELPGSAIALIQRGISSATTTRVEKTKETKLDIGKAILTGGLAFTKKVEKQTTHTQHSQSTFVLLHRNDGEPDVMLHERQINYRFLGPSMEAGSAVNLTRTLQLLQSVAPTAPVDDRAARPGFTLGFQGTGRDSVDIALHAVHLAYLMGAAR